MSGIDRIASVQNISHIFCSTDETQQQNITAQLQELINFQRQVAQQAQQAQFRTSPLHTPQSLIVPQLQNGINGWNHLSEEQRAKLEFITCKLCQGYLIDAHTLESCMHTFCKTCAVKYIKERRKCPDCRKEIMTGKISNKLRPDPIVQNIVYQMIPGLYEKEMGDRRDFYADREGFREKSEWFGDIPPAKTHKDDDMFDIGLSWERSEPNPDPIKVYFHCRADTTIAAIEKLIIAKFGLDGPVKIYFENREISWKFTTLKDVAIDICKFKWNPNLRILNFRFMEQDSREATPVKIPYQIVPKSSPQTSLGRDP